MRPQETHTKRALRFSDPMEEDKETYADQSKSVTHPKLTDPWIPWMSRGTHNQYLHHRHLPYFPVFYYIIMLNSSLKKGNNTLTTQDNGQHNS